MNRRYPLRPLGDVLTLDLDPVAIEPTATYHTAGILSYGRGLFARPAITGAETSYKQYFCLHRDQVVFSRLFAWEGAAALVVPEFDGYFVSSEFPTLTVDSEQAVPSYLGYLMRWPEFHELLAGATRGLGLRRQRVHVDEFLAIKVPLPDIEEQRRVVTWLDDLLHRQEVALSAIQTHSADVFLQALPPLVGGELQNVAEGVTTVSELVKLVGDVVHPGDDPGAARQFVGLQHVESHTGRRLGADPVGNEKGRKFRFEPGDVVYGYLRPYLNKAWVADRHGLCSVDQYVLRPTGRMSSSLIGYVLRSLRVLEQARVLTHNLQLPRLRSGLLMTMNAPDIPLERQAEMESRLNALSNRICAIAGTRRRQCEAVDALGRAALNRAFAGITS
jgi:type I restriction enzyme S subunit